MLLCEDARKARSVAASRAVTTPFATRTPVDVSENACVAHARSILISHAECAMSALPAVPRRARDAAGL